MSEELFDKSNDNRIRQNGLIMNTDEVVDLLNSQSKLISAYQYEFVKMRKENEQLKKTEKINMEYAEQIVKENQKLRIAKNDLRIENENLQKQMKSFETTMNATSDYNAYLQSEVKDLKKENERLKNKLNITALELVDEAISMGKAVEISEMNYHEFLEYRKKNEKPMELQI